MFFAYFKFQGVSLIFCLLSVFFLSGCAEMNVKNPFVAPEPSSVDEVYYADFSDIPIPKDMELKRSKSMVSQAGDGSITGYLSFSGSLLWTSLVDAVIYNMNNAGWVGVALFRGEVSVLIFERNNRFCIFNISKGVIAASIMDIWVLPKLSGIPTPTMPPSQAVDGDGSVNVSPAEGAGSGGIKEQGLTN